MWPCTLPPNSSGEVWGEPFTKLFFRSCVNRDTSKHSPALHCRTQPVLGYMKAWGFDQRPFIVALDINSAAGSTSVGGNETCSRSEIIQAIRTRFARFKG